MHKEEQAADIELLRAIRCSNTADEDQPILSVNAGARSSLGTKNLLERKAVNKPMRGGTGGSRLSVRQQPEPGLVIVDARPWVNARANQAMGKGTENVSRYEHCEVEYMDIPNIHEVRNSFNKVTKLCRSTAGNDPNWWSHLQQTKWLLWLRYIMAAASAIVLQVEVRRVSVLVHCSDGW